MVDKKIVLEMIKSSKEGVLQSDIWKSSGIDSRKCSKIVQNLESEGLIKRTWETSNGARTFRILYIGDQPKYNVLMAGEKLAPCIGCLKECAPEFCIEMSEWVQKLVETESESVNN
ncbi:MAG: Lrp/AsnC family transcriptional regulator [Halobacteriota archaeon]|nr:Lrp/AsnC family transcriptional regulator [Halobacteriota archaeon]